MTNTVLMDNHLSSEQIAAFVDGRLGEPARHETIAHFAVCDECRELFDVTSDAVAEGVASESKVVPIRRPAKWPAIATLTAAAAVAGAFLPPVRYAIEDYRTGGVSALVREDAASKKRPIEGRLSGGFSFKRFSRPRGGEGMNGGGSTTGEIDEKNYKLELEALRLKQTTPKSPKKLRAVALAELLTEPRGQDAVPLLEKAVSLDDNNAALWNDLSVAYLERLENGDADRALAAAKRAWAIEQTPESAWNIALAYDGMDKKAEAVRAWQEYLKLDPNSPWSEEAKRKLQTLRDFQ
jgi:tetratricopeptide (TPR) repeat protein